MDEPLHIQSDTRGIYTLTLNRPRLHNALDEALIDALHGALRDIAADPAARVVVLTGAGESFCSGADLRWLGSSSVRDLSACRQDAARLGGLMEALECIDVPAIARVNGPAYGGGIGLIACCDIAVACRAAQFAFTEVRLGLAPAVIAPYVLMALGPRRARRLFLTAERFSGDAALEYGLLHQVVKENDLDAAVASHTERLLKGGAVALRESKRLIRELAQGVQGAGAMADLNARLRVSEEGREGVAAFLEKRKPRWDPAGEG